MTGKSLETRIAKLERFRQPTASYVVSVSDPPTSDEQAELAQAKAEGRFVAILPHKCANAEEWLAKFASKGAQH
jgi:hypothetical protein